MRRITASRLPLLDHCLYPARVDVAHPAEVESEAAGRGTARHHLAASTFAGLEIDAAAYDAAGVSSAEGEEWLARVRETVGALLPDAAAWEVEPAYAYDPATDRARRLHVSGPRDYSQARAWEICGSADIVAVGESVVVVDLKTGAGARSRSHRRQIEFLALAAARTAGASAALALVVHVGEDGTGREIERYYLGPNELDDAAAWVATLAEHVPGAEPSPGTHCRDHYCPLRGLCPATVEAVAEIVRHEAALPVPPPASGTYPLAPTILSAAHAAHLLARLPVVEMWVERVREALRAYADAHGGVECADGRMWVRVQTSEERVELTAAAEQVLAELLGEHASGAVERSTSKSAITTAARRQAPPRKGSALAEQIFARLREAGAMKRRMKTTYETVARALPEGRPEGVK